MLRVVVHQRLVPCFHVVRHCFPEGCIILRLDFPLSLDLNLQLCDALLQLRDDSVGLLELCEAPFVLRHELLLQLCLALIPRSNSIMESLDVNCMVSLQSMSPCFQISVHLLLDRKLSLRFHIPLSLDLVFELRYALRLCVESSKKDRLLRLVTVHFQLILGVCLLQGHKLGHQALVLRSLLLTEGLQLVDLLRLQFLQGLQLQLPLRFDFLEPLLVFV
mmetsp:Transcript_126026/g.218362  ORF Transcript_126026/g.218362 Transcript_126026/m.218362 type:complete len:219 (-) Transcript_126026:894-1550(-)